MKKTKFLFLLIIPIVSFGQSDSVRKAPSISSELIQGIHFESGLTWPEIQAKAKAENKFIFMDCYATWCGPCKFMSDSIFVQDEVGEYMNDHFINVAVQMDQTSKDNDDIRKWYDDAKSIADKYSINTFPTYLFFSPDGQVVHRFVGATGTEAKNFVDKAKQAFDLHKQYYTYIGNYKIHLNDSEYLRNALAMALHASDAQNAEEVADAYVNCLRDPFQEYNLRIIHDAVRSSKDKGFALFLNNATRIDSVFHRNGIAEGWVRRIIADEEISPLFLDGNPPIRWQKVEKNLKAKYPTLNEEVMQYFYSTFENNINFTEIRRVLYKKGAPMANWVEITKNIKHQYPGYDPDRMIALEKPKYDEYKKMWPECIKDILFCVGRYDNQLDKGYLNTFAWDVFMHSSDTVLLSKALGWSRRTIADSSNNNKVPPEYLDTYANIIYKLGNREKAIIWENKALVIEQSQLTADSSFEINLKISIQRMERGESTWEQRNGLEEYQ